MWVYAAKPTFYVGRGTWERGGLLWYAGSIAHDSVHSRLYHDEKKRLNGAEPAALVWTGSQAEKVCMLFQSGVLEELGADKKTLDFMAESIGVTVRLADAPTYQNGGAGNPDVCAERDW